MRVSLVVCSLFCLIHYIQGASVYYTDDNSCSGRCGYYDATKPCQCNNRCDEFNNCCSDFNRVCASCVGRCGSGTDSSMPCQCNSACERFNDCCDDYSSACSSGPTDTALRNIASTLYSLDESSRLVNGQDYHTSSNGDKFFTYVNEDFFNKPTFKAFIDLLDNYNPAVGVEEPDCPVCEAEIDTFLNNIMETTVMQRAWEFLISYGLASGSENTFKSELKQWWFQTYRRSNVYDSSGFEHVFVGETRSGSVTGFHNWIQFYEEEKKGDLKYTSDLGECRPRTQRFSMVWNGNNKPISSIFVGTSPEFELAVYSVCFAARANSNCPITLDGRSNRIISYTFSGYPKTVGTAYPDC